ncbi:GNAT family N-acetyltransferase [Leptobacterium sp. I13]|uniref:GNAT family N-acetyltransferase n=1 Tax=Leptobacterium meishanense TaxID=3128904 RepID=UPI0030EF8777
MNYIIRDAKPEDMPQVLNLIKELAIFEREPEAVVVTVEDLQRDGYGDQPLFHCFVAEKEGVIVGMALIYPRYSTWKGKTIHLEDLIVTEKMRGTGLGTALFSEVIKYGHKQGVRRIEWVVLDWNEPAITFYENNGAQILRDWDAAQLDEEGIKKYISKL